MDDVSNEDDLQHSCRSAIIWIPIFALCFIGLEMSMGRVPVGTVVEKVCPEEWSPVDDHYVSGIGWLQRSVNQSGRYYTSNDGECSGDVVVGADGVFSTYIIGPTVELYSNLAITYSSLHQPIFHQTVEVYHHKIPRQQHCRHQQFLVPNDRLYISNHLLHRTFDHTTNFTCFDGQRQIVKVGPHLTSHPRRRFSSCMTLPSCSISYVAWVDLYRAEVIPRITAPYTFPDRPYRGVVVWRQPRDVCLPRHHISQCE